MIKRCDICDRSVDELPGKKKTANPPKIQIDGDGLWVCEGCISRMAPLPVESPLEDALDPRLKKLIGCSAGAICRTLNLPYEPPYRSIIDMAAYIAYDQNLFMSIWSFLAQWDDGTTVWHSPEGDE